MLTMMNNNKVPQPSETLDSVSRKKSNVYKLFEDRQSVRFLVLQSGSGSDPLIGSLVFGSLDLANIEQLPPYEAVSYVWGTGDRKFELICDGDTIYLTQSIYDALRRVRLPDQPRRLWADQVCIDQDDEKERSQQVKLMNLVYKNAKRVLVWLGRDYNRVAERAGQTVRYLNEVFMDGTAHADFKRNYEENLATQSSEPWIPLAMLTKLPWFHRVWIVQEIGTTAPATLYWGDTEIDWDTLSFVATVLSEKYYHFRTRFSIITSSVSYLRRRFVEPDTTYYDRNKGHFAYELHKARPLLAGDNRDRVYAFLGHYSIDKGGKELQNLTPDYSKSLKDVYIDVAVRVLRGAADLVLLSSAHYYTPRIKSEDFGLPSWVPDWRHLPLHILNTPSVPHRAAKDTKPYLTIDENSQILYIRGVRVDVLVTTSLTIDKAAFRIRQEAQETSAKEEGRESLFQQKELNQRNATWPIQNNNKYNNYRTQQQDHSPHQQQNHHQDGPYAHTMVALWKHICGFDTFDLKFGYPLPRTTPTAITSTNFSPYSFFTPSLSSESSQSITPPSTAISSVIVIPPIITQTQIAPTPLTTPTSATFPASLHDYQRSAFFAFIQTLTNACINLDRSRPYSAIPPDEFLASGAAYLVRYAQSPPVPSFPPSSSSNSTAQSHLQTFSPSFSRFHDRGRGDSITRGRGNSRSRGNGNGNIGHKAIKSPPLHQIPVSPEIYALSRNGDPFKWSHEAVLFTRHRRFAVTRKGYFVLGPGVLQEGDVVVVLRGGKVPFLLRRVSAIGNDPEGGWVLVGECYVHGLMDGEKWDVEGVEEEVFSIK